MAIFSFKNGKYLNRVSNCGNETEKDTGFLKEQSLFETL